MNQLQQHSTLTLLALVSVFLSGCDKEPAAWETARNENSIEGYETYLENHPDGANAQAVRSLLDELLEEAAWKDAVSADSPSAYRSFAEQFPDSDKARVAGILATAMAFGSINISQRVRTPPNSFMRSDPTGQIQYYPDGTTMEIQLTAELDGEPVTTTISSEFDEMVDGRAYFRSENGDCFMFDRTAYGSGPYIRLCDDDMPRLPASDTPEEILKYAWEWLERRAAADAAE